MPAFYYSIGARYYKCERFTITMEVSCMKTQRRTADEQYQLIMECRSSGLSDYQWSTEHNINPGTFYNWVKRLRKKACYDIPSATGRGDYKPALKPDVVKLEVIPDHQNPGIPTVESTMLPLEEPCPTIEVMPGTESIKISNDVDPKLLSQILKAVTGTC